MIDRESGILLHLTSLPSAYGIGDMGPGAFKFIDFLSRADQRVWQVLPLNPTDSAHGNSPYSSSSAFAGNPLLISPDMLIADGFINLRDTQPVPAFPDEYVDFPAVREYKNKLLDLAFEGFRIRTDRDECDTFSRDNAFWLDDYSLFATLKQENGGKVWTDWPEPLRDRDSAALDEARSRLADEIERTKFYQFLFYHQWKRLQQHARENNVRILGDIPIYVNFDSADTWAHTEIFKLDENKRPVAVAGVPPDYFSKTGQLWGNPVYDWHTLTERRYDWWIQRLEHMFRLYDMVRIDHFRGLIAYWEVPAGHRTAVDGTWVEVPFDDFFTTMKDHFDDLPVIAEDLGTITEDVTDAMERYGFPGMKVLLFAFGEDNPDHPYLPHNFEENTVVYTGTHDNNTALGWFRNEAGKDERRRLFEYLGGELPAKEIPWALIRMALRSRARLAIFPMQDLLALGGKARMNRPATRNGNWIWRLRPEQLTSVPAESLAEVVKASGRVPPPS